MPHTTLLFLVKKSDNKITDICLAMKKRGFGAGRWNGVGGKLNEGETFEQGVMREAQEEVSVEPNNVQKVAELTFTFPANPDWNQIVETFVTESWEGEPTESEEMAPKWFSISDIPYADMWPDDIFWLPKVLEGNLVKAKFTFGEKDSVLEQFVEVVPDF